VNQLLSNHEENCSQLRAVIDVAMQELNAYA